MKTAGDQGGQFTPIWCLLPASRMGAQDILSIESRGIRNTLYKTCCTETVAHYAQSYGSRGWQSLTGLASPPPAPGLSVMARCLHLCHGLRLPCPWTQDVQDRSSGAAGQAGPKRTKEEDWWDISSRVLQGLLPTTVGRGSREHPHGEPAGTEVLGMVRSLLPTNLCVIPRYSLGPVLGLGMWMEINQHGACPSPVRNDR